MDKLEYLPSTILMNLKMKFVNKKNNLLRWSYYKNISMIQRSSLNKKKRINENSIDFGYKMKQMVRYFFLLQSYQCTKLSIQPKIYNINFSITESNFEKMLKEFKELVEKNHLTNNEKEVCFLL